MSDEDEDRVNDEECDCRNCRAFRRDHPDIKRGMGVFTPDMPSDEFCAAMDDFLERLLYISVAALMAGHRRMPPSEFHRVNGHLTDAFMRDVTAFFSGHGYMVLRAVDQLTKKANDLLHRGEIGTECVSGEEWQERVNDPNERMGMPEDKRAYGMHFKPRDDEDGPRLDV